jgi:hypothetical protein
MHQVFNTNRLCNVNYYCIFSMKVLYILSTFNAYITIEPMLPKKEFNGQQYVFYDVRSILILLHIFDKFHRYQSM